MGEWIRRLSPRGELVLVCAVALTLPIVASAGFLIERVHVYAFTTARLLRMAGIQVLLLAAVGGILRLRGWEPRRLGLRFSPLAALAGVPLFITAIALYVSTALIVGLFVRSSLETMRMPAQAPLALAMVVFFINSIYEETIVGAYVIEALSDRGPLVAIAAGMLLRLAYHLYQGPIALLTIVPFGILFGAVYWKWRTVWPLIVAHTLMNILSFVGRPNG